MPQERLIASAIRRNGRVSNGIKGAHWEVRAALGDEMPSKALPGDREGYLTSLGRFVDRFEAHEIACASGQTSANKLTTPGGQALLSSEVTSWD